MKKIFAIALALVMVLSMASAFAMTCNTNWSWDCAVEETDCGKAKVEVIPYVVENGCGTPRVYNGNACATAINGENIYWAVKLTTEADFSTEWAATATVKVTVKGTTKDVEFTVKGLDKLKSSKEYYVKATKNTAGKFVYSWVEVNEDFEISDVIFKNVVKDAYKAKVCAQLTAGLDLSKNKTTKSNGYTVSYDPTNKTITFVNDDATVVLALDANDKVWLADVTTGVEDIYGKLTVAGFDWQNGTANITIVFDNISHTYKASQTNGMLIWDGKANSYTFKSGDQYGFTVYGITENVKDKDVVLGQTEFGFTTKGYNKAGDAYLDASNRNLTYGFSCAPGKFLYNVFQKFNIDFGTCMTKKAINKNFGWDDDFGKVCYSWNTKGVAIVNPECKIEIPKTGDVSVVAYAVMALVAAAGAMGLKK